MALKQHLASSWLPGAPDRIAPSIKVTIQDMQAPGMSTGANGIDGPLNPFGVDPPSPDLKDDEIPGYVKRFGAYHTLTEGVFLPAGTLLPLGASFSMQSTVDFGLHFPNGTKVPGGFLLPVSVVKKAKAAPAPAPTEAPLCSIQ